MSSAKPSLVMGEVQGLVQSIAEFTSSTVFVYDDDDLASKLKGAKFPAIGIIYNGMRSLGQTGATAKIGVSCEMMFTLMLVQQGQSIVSTDTKLATIDLLDSIRGAILGVRSVTGHFYHFMMEAQGRPSKGLIFWGQRWSVPVQLTPKN